MTHKAPSQCELMHFGVINAYLNSGFKNSGPGSLQVLPGLSFCLEQGGPKGQSQQVGHQGGPKANGQLAKAPA